MTRIALLLMVAVAFVACAEGPPVALSPGTTVARTAPATAPPPASRPLTGLAVRMVASGLDRPVAIGAPLGDERLFIVEQPGRVRVVANGVLLAEPFLDIESLVRSEGLEQGLLGLAFHPRFGENRRFFVYYTDLSGDSRLVEFHATPGSNVTDTEGITLLEVDQPHQYHNGGMLLFDPDGYLWISLGDGGGNGDPRRNAQRPTTLLGSLLRIDVNSGTPYSAPPDNPFVVGGGRREVWAYGLRNPWGFAIDPVDRLVYIADVGHGVTEEVDVVPLTAPGQNFGWPVMEGDSCYVPDAVREQGGTVECSDAGFTPPVHTYPHDGACAIVGGPVYRGSELPELWGHYFYGDWCGGWVRSFRYEGGQVSRQHDWSSDLGPLGQILTIAAGPDGDLFLGTGAGDVLQIIPVRSGLLD